MKTLKLRIKDKHTSVLNQLARQVNFVWNYSNALCFQHLQRTGKFFSAAFLADLVQNLMKTFNAQLISESLIVGEKR